MLLILFSHSGISSDEKPLGLATCVAVNSVGDHVSPIFRVLPNHPHCSLPTGTNTLLMPACLYIVYVLKRSPRVIEVSKPSSRMRGVSVHSICRQSPLPTRLLRLL